MSSTSSGGESRSDHRGWVRPQELAAQERISRRTVWRWVREGKLEVRRLDARKGVRVREPDWPDE
jgi:predicted site-specific integrase-resolvase